MGFFDLFKGKKKASSDDCLKVSALGDNPDAWKSLGTETLKQVVMVKCLEYGASQDGSRIPKLFALYRYAMTRLDINARMELLTEFIKSIEELKGQGHMGLMMFLIGDNNPAICSTAAMSLAVLFDPQDGDNLAGPKFVVHQILKCIEDAELQGKALGGILLLGDKRLLPLLGNAWEKLSKKARLALTYSVSEFVLEGIVEFWISCLENGCSEAAFGSIVASIAKMPEIAQIPFVFDVERVLPAYMDSENPMRMLNRTSFGDYLEEIRPRLEALEAEESEPKLIPRIYESWENS